MIYMPFYDSFESLRREMVMKGLKYGIGHPKVIRLSTKLDKLHNIILKYEIGNIE